MASDPKVKMASDPKVKMASDPEVMKVQLLLEYVKANAKMGDPASVLATMDKFCWEKHTNMMHIGAKKGEYIGSVVKELAPMTCLELGTYCGYSAILMASVLPKGSQFLTIEINDYHANVAKEIIEMAGVDKVTIINKPSEEVIPVLHTEYSVDTLDFVFIDHWKELYKRDILLLEKSGALRKGTVIVADNIFFPGAPDYLAYVQNSGKYQTEMFHCKLEYSDKPDAIAHSVYTG